ncbi:MAG: AraC family transcriptional regulator [Dysgonamonadaceae bacterium]|jgi:AraC-like DNA-binding protein|nr:AraC family transcriptional regulator [Dysgonamonadaceae bacterium]
MKYKELLLLLFILLLPFRGTSQDTYRHEKDSLRKALSLAEGREKLKTYDLLTGLYLPEAYSAQARDTLLALFREYDAEAQKQENTIERVRIRGNTLVMFGNGGQFDEVIRRAPDILDFIAQQDAWKYYYMSCSIVVNAYRRKNDNEAAMHEARKMYEHAKARNDAGGMGIAFYAMSKIHISQRRFEEREKALKECIALLKDSLTYINALTDAYQDLAHNYLSMKRYDDALLTVRELEEKIIPRYEEAFGEHMPVAWGMVYTIYADAFRLSGRYDEAEKYLNKYDSITNFAFPSYEERADILMGRKRYAEALEMAEKAVQTYSPAMKHQAIALKMEILVRMGQADSAMQAFNKAVAAIDSLHSMEINTRLDEIRTRYEVDKHIAEKQRNRNYFLLALGGCLLLLIALGIWIYHDRMLTAKNRELVRKNRQWANLLPAVPADTEKNVAPDAMDRAIMNEIEKLIAGDLYKDSNLSLDMLAKKMNQNPTYISKAISHCMGKNFKTYINEYRVKEAIRLLSEKDVSNRSIDDIAFASGFNDRKTFHRVFKKTTGLTPSEFRKNASFKE